MRCHRRRHQVAMRSAVLLLSATLLGACSNRASPAPIPVEASTGGAAPSSAEAGADAGALSLPFAIGSYPEGNGKYFLVAVSVGGRSFNVLLDTGSSGLRLFSPTPVGTLIGDGGADTFGSGETCGPTEKANVSFGGVSTPAPIAFQRGVSCPDAGGDVTTLLAPLGIDGILGVSLRADTPQDIYSPFAQLGAPLGSGFLIHTGGYSAASGTITLGVSADALPDFQSLTLHLDPRRTSGSPAWIDTPSVCLFIGGVATNPPCSAANFDTGGNTAIVYDTAPIPPASIHSGILTPGTAFEAKAFDPENADGGPAFDYRVTVGNPPTASLDAIEVQARADYTNLGIEVFFRYDVAFDIAKGRLAFRSLGK